MLLHDQATWLEESYDKGIDKGKERGIEKGRVAEAFFIAKALKEKCMIDTEIAQVTGLSLE